ncbi:MAG: MFS transporter [Actinomycetota bacterium]|nr:MFS transporter [Actinomycetota bacterium]
MTPRSTGPRRRIVVGHRLAFALVAYAFAVTMLGTTLPTPLYPLYQARMGFSEAIVTVIFAAYAVGVIAALVLVGSWSDQVGRRPMLLAGLALSAASAVTFLVGGSLLSLPALLIGRVVSGLSAGIFTGTASVAVVELAPPERRGWATLIATAANMGGLGLGPVVAGVLAQYVALPLLVPFITHLVLLAVATVGVVLAPETVEVAHPARLRPQRLQVPAEVRGVFVPAAIAGFAGFMVLGLFTAVAPAFLAQVLGLSNHVLTGLVVFALFAASTAGQLALERVPQQRALPIGCLILIVGVGLVGTGIGTASLIVLLTGAVVAGLGQGLGFRAGLASVTAQSPSDRRGEVTSSLFTLLYVAISIPVIGVGVAAQGFGLVPATLAFAAIVATLSGVALAILLRRVKPSTEHHSQ